MRTTIPLHLAVDFGAGDLGWVRLTPTDPGVIDRFRASTLREAAIRRTRSSAAAFVDLDVHLAESVAEAFAGLAAQRPGWRPGAPTDSLVHAGTTSTLAGLLWDIWAARVADGVTLRAADPHLLSQRVVADVLPSLAARGLVVGTRSSAVAS